MRAFERTPPEAQELLRKPIRDLGLRIDGSPVQAWVEQLYAELETKRLHHFRPACYLTDEWGCPSEEPVIGIPFYLADRRLRAIENAVNDLEDEHEAMMYLRHEAGHAFNYAYELYKTKEWRDLFGPFRRAYRDEYTPVPFSRRFVRHIAGWYAQKHPDEDFAETFAVWLTPGSSWKKRYEGWGALKKLQYVDRIASEVSDNPPLRPLGEIDYSVEEMESTVEEFYVANTPDEAQQISDLLFDSDLTDIFAPAPVDKARLAAEAIGAARKTIIDKVAYWTGVRRTLVKALVERIEERVLALELTTDDRHEETQLVELTAYVTTLAMNYLTRGTFVQEK